MDMVQAQKKAISTNMGVYVTFGQYRTIVEPSLPVFNESELNRRLILALRTLALSKESGSQSTKSGSKSRALSCSQSKDQSGSQSKNQSGSQCNNQSGSQYRAQARSQSKDRSKSQPRDRSGSQPRDQSGSRQEQPKESKSGSHRNASHRQNSMQGVNKIMVGKTFVPPRLLPLAPPPPPPPASNVHPQTHGSPQPSGSRTKSHGSSGQSRTVSKVKMERLIIK